VRGSADVAVPRAMARGATRDALGVGYGNGGERPRRRNTTTYNLVEPYQERRQTSG
jgi:hypothetical protein